MTDPTQKLTAVLLIAHGSRRPEANAELERVAEAIRERKIYETVAVSYLEIASPTIPEGARKCIRQGAGCVLMMPYFLSSGNHVVEDLERHRTELTTEFPDVAFKLCKPLGLHPQMIEVVMDRLQEVDENDG